MSAIILRPVRQFLVAQWSLSADESLSLAVHLIRGKSGVTVNQSDLTSSAKASFRSLASVQCVIKR